MALGFGKTKTKSQISSAVLINSGLPYQQGEVAVERVVVVGIELVTTDTKRTDSEK